MGFYIEVPEIKEKAKQLKQLYDAQLVLSPQSVREVPKEKVLVCVIENPGFDAVGVINDDRELRDFQPSPNDDRPRSWLLMDRGKVLELVPRVEKWLTY